MDRLVLTIEDHGYGISALDQLQLFTPFFRSADSRRRGISGLGLGLAIAKRLAGAFGGKLEVQSTLVVGTKVTLSLPLV